MSTDLRIGFLGTGGIANVHGRALAKQPGAKIVALCDRAIEKARAFNAAHAGGAARTHADFAEMLKAGGMDALYVCLPPGAHGGEIEAAAKAGLHLYLEKPIALALERGRSIHKAVRAAGVTCVIGHHYRHAAAVVRLKAMIADGRAGTPALFQGRFLCNALHGAWWRDPAMGGGQLVEQAIHVYDLARHFLGEARAVTAFAGNLLHAGQPDYRVDDTSAATILFAGGAIGSIAASNGAVPREWATSFDVVCRHVTASFRSPTEATFVHTDGMTSETSWAKSIEPRREEVAGGRDPYEEATRNFLAAVRGEEAGRSDIDDGLRGLELVLGALASARAGGAPQRLEA
jgi:predicted dehydrogenase